MSNSKLNKLQYLPASFFGMIMGMTGLSIAVLKLPEPIIGIGLIGFTSLLFVLLLSAYLYKIIKFRDDFWLEMKHPIKINFIPAISISLLLLSAAYHNLGLIEFSKWLWVIGAILHLILTIWVLYNWIHHDFFKIEHSNPAWFIPIVGNIIVPVAGVYHFHIDISWFFFSIGLVFWIILKAILLNRIIFYSPMMEKLIPTLFIFIAPPAVGFISYMALNQGELNQFAKILYLFALFMTLLMAVSVGKFTQLKFALSSWAYTFPLAAMTIASFIMAKASGIVFYQVIGFIILFLLVIIIGWLLVKTTQAIINNKICSPEH